MRQVLLSVPVMLACLAVAQSTPKRIDTAHSKITVYAYKTGLFSFAAHDHVIQVPIAQGTVDETTRSVQFKVKTADLQVLDPEDSPKNRAEIRAVMLGPKLLEAEKFPEISFHSISVTQTDATTAAVKGILEMHGVKRDVSLTVKRDGARYLGSTTLKQTDYRLTPVTVAGGTVKVKDEVKIEFSVVTEQ